MNDDQHTAVLKVEECRSAVRDLNRQLMDAKRKLKRAEAAVQTAIRRDPASWNEITTVQES